MVVEKLDKLDELTYNKLIHAFELTTEDIKGKIYVDAEWETRDKKKDITVTCDGLRFKINNQTYISSETAKTLPLDIIQSEKFDDAVATTTVASVNIPDVNSLSLMFKMIYTFKEVEIIHSLKTDTEENKLRSLLIPLMIYQGYFISQYSEYLESPDIIVKVDDSFTNLNNEDKSRFIQSICVDSKINPVQIRVLCHLLLLLLHKNFNGEDPIAQKEQFITKRPSACFSTMNSASSKLPWSNEEILSMTNSLQDYPKLRLCIYRFLYLSRNKYSELSLAMDLSSYTQMAAAQLIYRMVSHPHKALIMIDKTFVQELVQFQKIVDDLKKEYGDNDWVYHKLLQPEDKSLIFTKFANLAHSAKAFLLAINPDDPVRRFKISGNRTIPDLGMKAKTPLPAVLTQSGISEFENFEKVAGLLSLNLEGMKNMFERGELDVNRILNNYKKSYYEEKPPVRTSRSKRNYDYDDDY